MCMKERINVLSTEMDCITAKEAMLKAIAFLERESVDIIEVLSMSALMRARDEDEWIRSTSGFGLILPGETEILEAAGETDRIKLREAENQTFIKMFMKYLQKNRKRVFLLAESEEKLNTVENAMKYYDKGIFLTGHALIKEGENREEDVVNEINGTETDCILSVLTSPYQEKFIAENQALLNVKLWFGCGTLLEKSYGDADYGFDFADRKRSERDDRFSAESGKNNSFKRSCAFGTENRTGHAPSYITDR